jgi:type II secretory pathway component GspD/PulD (secretin)
MKKIKSLTMVQGFSSGKLLSSFFVFACLSLFVNAETVTVKTNPLTGEKTKFDPAKGKLNVKSVSAQLRDLLVPSKKTKSLKDARKYLKPYCKIIKGPEGKSTLVFRCRYTQAKDLINSMESTISPLGTVEFSEDQNLVIINDKSEKMDELKNTLLAIDIPSPQVLVEAKIVEVLLSDGMQRNFALTFNNSNRGEMGDGTVKNLNSEVGLATTIPGQPSSDLGGGFDWYPWVSGTKNIHATIQWLLNAQDAKVLSSPNVLVSRNATASIVTGQDLPIQTLQVVSGSTTTSTVFKRVGVVLNVTPKLINRDSVTLGVNPQVSNVLKYQQFVVADSKQSNEVPVISIRNIETELTLKDGQIIMLGGLYTHRESLQQERIPFLSDIPFIGEFFTAKNRAKELVQLIFFLKVNILSDEEIADGIIYDPEKQAEDSKKIGNIIRNSKQIFPPKETTLESVKKEFIEKNPAYR